MSDTKPMLEARIPLAEEIEVFDQGGNLRLDSKGRPIMRRQEGRTLVSGKDRRRVFGETVVTLTELDPATHDSEMSFELRIQHPPSMGNDEVNRFADEKSARDHFEAFVTALATQSFVEPKKLLGPLTVPGTIALDD